MGWLRDLMEAQRPGVRSYDALARQALAHSEWPVGAKPRPRSLAALFSKLDRGQELEWLADRIEVQQVLADVLGVPGGTIGRAVGEKIESADRDLQRLRLDDVPFSRPILLTQEALPPGLPEDVLCPQGWNRLFWRAPSGSGRSLVGTWLASRGLATFVDVRDPGTAREAHAHAGPLFIELHAELDSHALVKSPPSSPICIASPHPPDAAELADAGFLLLDSPPAHSYAEELVKWVADRLPRDAEFDVARAAKWLSSLVASEPPFSLGALLGLLGVFDELGAAAVEGRSLAQIAETFLEGRLTRAAASASDADSWIRREGFGLLRSLGKRLLTDSHAAWWAPRSFDEWVGLIPPEYERGIDIEWVQLSLSTTTDPVTVKELERALRKLPPGGLRVTRLLRSAGVLRSDVEGTRMTLSPQWLSEHIYRLALNDLTGGSPFEWGEALVRTHSTEAVVATLQRTWGRDGTTPVDELLELENSNNPAYIGALELAFRVTGLRLLSSSAAGTELTALWDAQMDVAVEFDDGPHPRLEYPHSVSRREPILSRASWLLAALAISEHVPMHEGYRHLLLRPWLLVRAPAGLESILDSIRVLAPNSAASKYVLDAFVMFARLRDALGGSLSSSESFHYFEIPVLLLDELVSGQIDPIRLGHFDDPLLLEATARLAETQGRDWSSLAETVLRTWDTLSEPFDDMLTHPGSRDLLWRHIPLDILDRWLARRALPALAYEAFDDDRWHLVLDHRRRRSEPSGLWESLPRAHFERALSERVPEPDALVRLWQMEPDLVWRELTKRSQTDAASAVQLARLAPPEFVDDILTAFEDASLREDADNQPVMAWLFDHVRERRPSWRHAFSLLSSLHARTRSH